MKNGIYKITSDPRVTNSSSCSLAAISSSTVASSDGGSKERINNYGATAGIGIHTAPTTKLPYPKSVLTLLGSMFFERVALNGMKSTTSEFITTVKSLLAVVCVCACLYTNVLNF